MTEEIGDNENAALIDVMERLHGLKVVEVGDIKSPGIVAIPEGMRLQTLKALTDLYLPKPDRREGTATLETVESFCRYMNRFKNDNSIVFATEEDPTLRGIVDHHVAGDDPTAARFCKHRATYKFPFSDEWIAWDAANDSEMTQGDFAEFLEDQLLDVIDPDDAGSTAAAFTSKLGIKLATPAQLLDLSKGLAVRLDGTAAQKVNLSTGESALSFKEEHTNEQGEPLHVPGGFVIGIPVFRGGAAYQLCARLRYRVRGNVTWTIKMHRGDLVFRHAFEEACDKVAADTELPVLQGSPES